MNCVPKNVCSKWSSDHLGENNFCRSNLMLFKKLTRRDFIGLIFLQIQSPQQSCTINMVNLETFPYFEFCVGKTDSEYWNFSCIDLTIYSSVYIIRLCIGELFIFTPAFALQVETSSNRIEINYWWRKIR